VIEHVQQTPTSQPPWAVDDPLGAHRAAHRVRWDQRTMASLAASYIVVLHLAMGREGNDLPLVVFVALPLLIRNRAAFAVIAPATGLLMLAAVVLAPPVAPAGLPLLLAQIRLPTRWVRTAAPILLTTTTAGLILLAQTFTVWLNP
jgi:hypothetical protein